MPQPIQWVSLHVTLLGILSTTLTCMIPVRAATYGPILNDQQATYFKRMRLGAMREAKQLVIYAMGELAMLGVITAVNSQDMNT
jgi:hypothetical protein